MLVVTACVLPLGIQLNSGDADKPGELLPALQDALNLQPANTPTPTPSPASRLHAAHSALFAGELDKAKSLYQEAFGQTSEEDLKAQALYGLGRTYAAEREYNPAIDAFNRLLGQFPQSDSVANAYFMLGQVYTQSGENLQAAAAYGQYLERSPGVLDEYVRNLQGDAAMSAGDYAQAIFAYQAALQADPPGNSAVLNLKIGQAYDAMQDYTTAIQFYLNTYSTSQDDYARSTANLLTGQAYQKLGQNEEAYKRFMDSVYQFPKAYDSFTALSILVSNNVPVPEFLRGLVNYYAGSYDFAIRAFDRYIESDPQDNDDSVHYFKGLSHYFKNDPRRAIEQYDILINNYPGNSYWSAAWDEKAYIQWADLNEYSNAANTYLTFVTSAPTSPDAPTFLYEAARTFERNNDLENAAQSWLRMMNEYPSANLSYRGLFMAGISYFRLSKYEDALQAFQRNLVLATSPAEKAKAFFWIGKAYQALGDEENTRNAFQSAQSADPTDYYSIRASEVLEGRDMFTLDKNYDLGYDLAFERPEAEAWLRSTFLIPAETTLEGMGDLESNPRVRRIRAYWQLGLYSKAINEAELLRGELQGDALNLYRLLNYLLELELYQPAIYACRNILDLAGLDNLESLTIPIYFTHVRFGAYFRELIVSAANQHDLHPLLFYSLIRQESMFNPFISSSAGASGLAQIMPATGKENVDLLGWPPNYQQSDLLRGEVSITLGAYYLKRMRNYLSGNTQAALAAYNAGPGNSESWLALVDGDPDLFLEVIRAEETQNYLMQITEFLNIYQLVYSRPQ